MSSVLNVAKKLSATALSQQSACDSCCSRGPRGPTPRDTPRWRIGRRGPNDGSAPPAAATAHRHAQRSSARSVRRWSATAHPTTRRREQVHEDRQIQPPLPGPDVRQVRHPDAIRRGHRELPRQPIRGEGMAMPTVGRAAPPLRPPARDLVPPHQPRHALATRPRALRLQLRVDPGWRHTCRGSGDESRPPAPPTAGRRSPAPTAAAATRRRTRAATLQARGTAPTPGT